jgi:hypothetical protein
MSTTTTTKIPTLKTFEVMLLPLSGDSVALTRSKRIDAAYFKRDDAFITFKDPNNKDVYAVQASAVLSIERVSAASPAEASA